jgi:hypothetical protein
VKRHLVTLQVLRPTQELVLLTLLLMVVVVLLLLVHSTQLHAAQKSPARQKVGKARSEVSQDCQRQRARGHHRAVPLKLAHPHLRAKSVLHENEALQ